MTRNKRIVVLLGLLVLLTAYGLYRNRDRLRNWTESERVDNVALAQLERATLSTAAKAEATTGWPQWRGPNRDGVAPAGPFRTDWKTNPPKLAWTVPCGGGYAQPIVVEGKLYLFDFAEGKERIRCLDANTGEVKWTHAEPADYSGLTMGYASGPRATPTYHKGHLYTVGATGRFQCLKLPAGTETSLTVVAAHDLMAEFDARLPQWGVACSPLIVNDSVIVQPGGKKGSIAAFNLTLNADPVWTVGTEPSGYCSPLLFKWSGGELIAAVTGETVRGIGIDGAPQWSLPWHTQYNGNIATPIAAGDYVFVSSNYGKGCTLIHLTSRSIAKEVYFRKNRVMANHHMTCVYKDGFLYGCDGSEWACVDLKKGEKVEDWQAADEDGKVFGKGSATLVGEHLLGLTETGTLFLGKADPKEFNCIGQVKNALAGRECWTAPVVVDGRIYLRDGEKIVCYDVR
jgi:outer membrane protein assembly factor BamB